MSAVDWTQFKEPWRSLGQEFADQLAGRSATQIPEITPEGLRRLRKARGLTIRQVADLASVREFSVVDAERGQSRRALRRIARVFCRWP